MTWAIWLAVPVGATALAAAWSGWRSWLHRRAARPPRTEDAVREHSAYLARLEHAPVVRTRRVPSSAETADQE